MVARLLTLIAALLAFAPPSIVVLAADEPFQMLVRLNDLRYEDVDPTRPPIKLLDVRPRSDYDAGHIPNSIWADIKVAEAIAARPGGLTDRAAWLDWITPLGLDSKSEVRVMGGRRQLDAARMWWLLRYLGVEKVGLVDGDVGFWIAQRRPITQEVREVRSHPFPVDFQVGRLATRDQVLAALRSGTSRIVDARTEGEYQGSDRRAKRGGHIPAACRLEWVEMVDQDGRFLPEGELRAKIAAAGVKAGEAVIAHCQGGGRASVDAFVFEMLGYPTRNYYPSWADWGNADDTPITTDESPSAPAQGAQPGNPGPGPFTVEYDYKCQWGHADEFLALFKHNHLPILRERIKSGDILKVSMVKPRIHVGEADRWDFRVTIEFRDAVAAFNAAADELIKARLFPDQKAYRAEEQRRFAILEGHTDLPVEPVDLDKPVTAP